MLDKIPSFSQVTIEGKIIPYQSTPAGRSNASKMQSLVQGQRQRTGSQSVIPPGSITKTPKDKTRPALAPPTVTNNPGQRQPFSQPSSTPNEVCLRQLATSLQLSESKPCKHGTNCKLMHIVLPAAGTKLPTSIKTKIQSTIERRYPGNSTFKDNLLAALVPF